MSASPFVYCHMLMNVLSEIAAFVALLSGTNVPQGAIKFILIPS